MCYKLNYNEVNDSEYCLLFAFISNVAQLLSRNFVHTGNREESLYSCLTLIIAMARQATSFEVTVAKNFVYNNKQLEYSIAYFQNSKITILSGKNRAILI